MYRVGKCLIGPLTQIQKTYKFILKKNDKKNYSNYFISVFFALFS